MSFLLLSILFNAYIGIVFIIFNRFKIDLFQAIVYNYGFCVLTGTFMLGSFPIQTETLTQPMFHWAMLMGFLFISVFNLIAISSVKVGVTITQTANKLSLVIPVIFSFFLYQEHLSLMKIAGILVALIAVILVSTKKVKSENKIAPWQLFLPVILFVSSGIIDTMTKYVQKTYLLNDSLSNTYLIAGFLIAFLLGITFLMISFIRKKRIFQWQSIVGGMLLGIPNYFSIYFLIQALQSKNMTSSAIIPINNIGVLFLVSLVGIIFFKEKLSFKNYLGLGFTLVAILLIFFGDKI